MCFRSIIIDDEIHVRGNWQVELCDNWTQLLSTLFRNYKIELLENIPKAFMANWSHQNLATFLGLSEIYLASRYTYLLVKYEQYTKLGKLRDSQFQNIELEPTLNDRSE